MDKLGAVGLIIPREEYRAIWQCQDEYEIEFILFQRDMDLFHLADDNLIDSGEVGRLLLEYLEMVDNRGCVTPHVTHSVSPICGLARRCKSEWIDY